MKALTPAAVIAGEAASGTEQDRWNDMLHIASVIHNRAAQLGVSVQDVIAVQKEFNAYNKALPSGAENYVDLAQEALAHVAENGPVTDATFFATPSNVGGLPKGLDAVGETAGHQFFTDPQFRAINTSQGLKKPTAVETADTGPGLLAGNPTSGGMAGLLRSAMPSPTADVGYNSTNDLGLGPAALPSVSYNMGRNRPNPPDQSVVDNIQLAVESVLGPDHSVAITSGQENPGNQYGADRHKTGLAADIAIYDPNGTRLTIAQNEQALRDVGQAYAAITDGSVGLGYKGPLGITNTFHVDQVPANHLSPGQDQSWGVIGNDPAYAAALDLARSEGVMPSSFYDRVANEVQTKGIVPTPRDMLTPSVMASYQPQQAAEANPFDALLSMPPQLAMNHPVTQSMPSIPAPQTDMSSMAQGIAAQRDYVAPQMPVDPMMQATQGPYTANGLTNMSGALSVPGVAVPAVSMPSQPAMTPEEFGPAVNPETARFAGPAMPSLTPEGFGPPVNIDTSQFMKTVPSAVAPMAVPGAMMAPNFSQAYNSAVNGMVNATDPGFSMPTAATGQTIQGPAQAAVPAQQYAAQPAARTTAVAPQQEKAQEQGFLSKLGITKEGVGLGILGGLVAGPVGGLIGGLLGRQMAQNGGMGELGLQPVMPGTINHLGTGPAAFAGVYGPGAVRGNTFTANNNATVTALGNGSVAYTNPFGVKEVHDADGSVSAVW